MKLGVVGAGLIVHTLLEFIHELEDVELIGICATPSGFERVKKLQLEHGFKYACRDIDELLAIEEIDIVYLGVNNQMHYLLGKKVLEAGKHLIMEKPFTSNYAQACRLAEMAKERKLLIFEAISTIYNPNFLKIAELLPSLGDIRIVTLNYTQYSSRYDAFRKGEILPAFDYRKSGGALMDLNIYNVHFVVKLFGNPKKVSYRANMEKGIDTSGILNLDYDRFKAVCIAAKDCEAPYTNCIEGNDGYIATDSPLFTLTDFEYKLRGADAVHYDLRGDAHRMKHEFIQFNKWYAEKDYESVYVQLDHSLAVMDTVTKAREDIGLVFPDDDNL